MCEYCRQSGVLTYPCRCNEVFYCNETCYQNDQRFHADRCKAQPADEEPTETNYSKKGLVGLQNLGNTCFMNSSLQCLSNCYELTRYFLTDSYKKDVNETNPIGSKGKIANAYANFLKHLWYGTSSVFSPSYFKRTLGDFQRMFMGYQQHDTQEFLNYLLDGLHEDLNRVKNKPFIEKDETELPDSEKSNLN